MRRSRRSGLRWPTATVSSTLRLPTSTRSKSAKASGGRINRDELFVTTKLWMSDYGYDQALHAFDRSLRKLGLDYVDLYLLHWPVPTHFDVTVASYKAAEKLLAEKRVRAIGVCNFSPE